MHVKCSGIGKGLYVFSLAFSNGNGLFRQLKMILFPSFTLSYLLIYRQMLSPHRNESQFFLKVFKTLSFKNLICKDY